MDRETILEKSRKEHVDEGELYLENKGRTLAFKVCTWLTSFYIVFSLFFVKDQFAIYAIMSIFWAVTSTEYYYKYKFSQSKSQWIGFVCSIIASVGFGLLSILDVFWM